MPLYNPAASGTVADGSVTNKQLSASARGLGAGWRPTGAIAQTINRDARMQDSQTLNTGLLFLQGGIVIPGGVPVNSITFVTSTTAGATLTHQWFCLVDQSLNVLGKTVDDTSTAWAASVAKTLNLSATYTPVSDIAVYLGCLVTAGTMPTLRGCVSTSAGPITQPPILAGTSTGTLTDPTSLGGTAAALTAGSTNVWAWIS